MSIRSVCRKSLQMKVWALKSGWWAALVVLCHIITPHGLKSVTSHLYAQRVWTHWEGGCSTWNHLFIQNVNKSVNKVGSLYAQRHFPPTIPSPLHKSSLHPLSRFIILTLPPDRLRGDLCWLKQFAHHTPALLFSSLLKVVGNKGKTLLGEPLVNEVRRRRMMGYAPFDFRYTVWVKSIGTVIKECQEFKKK